MFCPMDAVARSTMVLWLGLGVGLSVPWAKGREADRTLAVGVTRAETLVVLRLENGVTVLYQRVPGALDVGVEEIHPVGLIDDPAGVAQASHLAEHLRCMSASGSFAAGESYQRLNTAGMGNAETMGDMTHYDLVVPKDQLDLALTIIAERLTSLRLDAQTIAHEAPRCDAEIAGVMQATGGPGFKFALAAVVQNWQHGLEQARLIGGLGAWTVGDAQRFVGQMHRADGLIVAIAGDVDPQALEAMVRQRLGGIAAVEARAEDQTRSIDWLRVDRDALMQWDVDASAVFVAYPPPTDPEECLAMTLWSTAAMGALAARPTGPAGLAAGAMLSNTSYPVGRLPLFAFVPVAAGNNTGEEGEKFGNAMESIAGGSGAGVREARALLRTLSQSFSRGMDQAAYNQAVALLTQRMGAERGSQMAIGGVALEMGLAWQTLGPNPSERLAALSRRDTAWWEGLVRRTVSAERRIVTRLEPVGE